MRKGENPKRFRKNLKNTNTNMVHACGSVWTDGLICRSVTSLREAEFYVETNEEITCKTCIRMRGHDYDKLYRKYTKGTSRSIN